ELTDDTRVKAELMELQLQLELEDIDEETYVAREAELMQQLREIREWRAEFGMGVAGGPVRVQPVARDADEVTAPPDESAPRVALPGEASIELDPDLDGDV
ncbi:MAG: gas vesicle protein GvpG, partial [Longimicrobiales bacterium]